MSENQQPLIDKPAETVKETQEWFTSLPDELQADKTLQNYQTRTMDQFAQDFIANKKMAGQKLRIPKEDADPKEWDEIYSKLGRPESAESYTIPEFEVPEGMEWKPDDDLLKEYQKLAYESGMSQKQFESLANKFIENEIKRVGQNGQNGSTEVDCLSELKKVWGEDKSNIIKNESVALEGIKNYLPEKLQEVAINRAHNDPELIQILYQFSKAMGEDKMDDTTTTAKSFETELQSVEGKIQQIRANPNYVPRHGHPDFNAAEHQKLTKEIGELYDQRTKILTENQMSQMKQQLQA